DPIALNRRRGFLRLVPIRGTRGVTADPQIANLADGDGSAGVVENARGVSRNDFAARAGPHRAGTVGDEHVKAFGGADRVEDFDAEAVAEAMEDAGGEGFAGGDGVADGGEIKIVISARVRKQRNEVR